MQKNLLLFILFSNLCFAQSISITAVIEGPCGSTDQESPRVIELYVDGTLDTSNYQIQVQLGTNWFSPTVFSGTYTDEFLYISSDGTQFDIEFPGVPPTNKIVGNVATFANGTRAVRIIDTANANAIVDIYGVDSQDGNGAVWEYTNSYAKRNNGTTASNTFNTSDWTIAPLETLTGLGSCNGSAILNDTVSIGSYNTVATINDRDALIALYNATNGANWTDPWDLSANENTWSGVTVDANSGRVTGLSIGFRNLNGMLPSEITSLSELITLNLSSNDIVGEIPSNIGNLSNLESLNLSFNDFTNIPVSLFDLQNLTFLSFQGNSTLSGFALPQQIGNLTALEFLSFEFCQLTGQLPIELGNLSTLKTLSMSSNNFTGFIPAEIGNLTNLELLSLSGSDFSGTAIPIEIWNLNNLKLLQLNQCNLNGVLPPEIGNLTSIENISLSQNNFTGQLPAEFFTLNTLKSISLSNNSFEGTLDPFVNFPLLQSLILSANLFSGNLTSNLSTNLNFLSLASNNFSGSIPQEWTNFANLQRLFLDYNDLSGSIPDFTGIPSFLSLTFRGNKFVFDDFESEFVNYNSNISQFLYGFQDRVDTIETISIADGDDITLSVDATTSLNNSYQWRKDGTDIAGATDRMYTITNASSQSAGDYECVITNSIVTGLTLTRNTITLDYSLGNETFNKTNISLYPNPTQDYLNINLDLLSGDLVKAKIVNFLGQVVFAKNNIKANDVINLNALADGIYILTLTNGTKSYSKKIIKK